MFDQVSSLNSSRTNWKIKVRVTRMWPSMSNAPKGNGGLKGYNLILLDDDNSHVHAYVYAHTWNTIADTMVEGGLYIISNFYTKEALGSLKPVSFKYIINFSPSTTIDKIEEDDFMIPAHKFEFLDLGDLFGIASSYNDAEYPEFSADLIGVIEDFESLSEIKTVYGDRSILKFRLTDGRHSHMVTVWGQHAVTTDALFKKIKERPVIAILASTKLKTFRSSVQISTLPSSKIYLNMDFEAVASMRQRLDEEGYIQSDQATESQSQTISGTPNTPVDLIQTLTLKQLSEKRSTEFLEKYFLCKVKVTNVEENESWWYKSCMDCFEEVTKLEGTFRCPKCKKNQPLAEKRYRIVILAEDETEAFNFVLLDRAAKRIIGKTATSFISDNLKAGLSTQFPSKIKDIVGKVVTLKIQVKHDNVLVDSSVFYATDAFEFPQPGSVSLETSASGFTNSSFGDNNVLDLSKSGDTPVSAKSSSKKIKLEV